MAMPCLSFEREGIEAEVDRVRSLGVDSLRTLWRTTFRSSPPPPSAKTSWRGSSAGTFKNRPSAGWIPRPQSISMDSRRATVHQPIALGASKPAPCSCANTRVKGTPSPSFAEGYVWREATYVSLSSIARAITGTAWNGPRFFGLRIDNGTRVSPPTRLRERQPGAILAGLQ
jgi:hypothetical protein